MTLRDSIHRLNSEHLTLVDGRAVKAPALLDELDRAVGGDLGAAGGSVSSAGVKIPIDADALDLRARIHAEILDIHHEMIGQPFKAHPRRLLGLWANGGATIPEWETYIERMSLEWIDRIETKLGMKAKARKLTGTPCPACGQSVHGDERSVCMSLACYDDRGALLKHSAWTATCAACGATWAGDEMTWLVKALAA